MCGCSRREGEWLQLGFKGIDRNRHFWRFRSSILAVAVKRMWKSSIFHFWVIFFLGILSVTGN